LPVPPAPARADCGEAGRVACRGLLRAKPPRDAPGPLRRLPRRCPPRRRHRRTHRERKKNFALRAPHSAFGSGHQLLKRLPLNVAHAGKKPSSNASLRRQTPKDDKWKERYPEPTELDVSIFPLPRGWAWASLQQLGFIVGGLTKTRGAQPFG